MVIGVAHRKEVIMNHFRDGRDIGLHIKYTEHTVHGGTAEGFSHAIRATESEDFLAMNGDELTNINISSFRKFHLSRGGVATIGVTFLESPFGIVRKNRDRVVSFDEKPRLHPYLVSIGVYFFNRQILRYLPETGSVEHDTFPILAKEKKLFAYRHDGYWCTVNTAKDVAKAELQLGDIFAGLTHSRRQTSCKRSDT